MKATVLLPRQQGHNPPAQQHPLPGSWEAWNLPRASLQTSSQDGKGTGTKPRRGWTQRLDYNASRTHMESQGLHEGHPCPRAREIPEGRNSQSGEEVWLSSPSSRGGFPVLLSKLRLSATPSRGACSGATDLLQENPGVQLLLSPAGWSSLSPVPDPSWNQRQDSPRTFRLRRVKFSVRSQNQSDLQEPR